MPVPEHSDRAMFLLLEDITQVYLCGKEEETQLWKGYSPNRAVIPPAMVRGDDLDLDDDGDNTKQGEDNDYTRSGDDDDDESDDAQIMRHGKRKVGAAKGGKRGPREAKECPHCKLVTKRHKCAMKPPPKKRKQNE